MVKRAGFLLRCHLCHHMMYGNGVFFLSGICCCTCQEKVSWCGRLVMHLGSLSFLCCFANMCDLQICVICKTAAGCKNASILFKSTAKRFQSISLLLSVVATL